MDEQEVKENMKPRFDLPAMIKRLREELLKLTQAEFGERLGVGKTAVSMWESGDNVPPAETCLKLASLAGFPDSLRLLEQAGLKKNDLLHIANDVLTDRGVSTAVGDRIVIPVETIGGEEAGAPIEVPASFVPHPLSTRAVLLDKKLARIAFAPGDLLVVDESAAADHTAGLERLRDQIVVFQFPPRGEGIEPRDWWRWPREGGILLGRLCFKAYFPQRLTWMATLGPFSDVRPTWNVSDDVILVGSWQYPDPHPAPESADEAERMKQAAYEEAKEQAPSRLRLRTGCHILGRGIAWFSRAGEKESWGKRKSR